MIRRWDGQAQVNCSKNQTDMMAQNNKLRKHIAGIGSKIEDERNLGRYCPTVAQQFGDNINAEVNPKTGTVTRWWNKIFFETNSQFEPACQKSACKVFHSMQKYYLKSDR